MSKGTYGDVPLQPQKLNPHLDALVDLGARAADDPFDVAHLKKTQVDKLFNDYINGQLNTTELSTVVSRVGRVGDAVLNLTPEETAEFVKATATAFQAASQRSWKKVAYHEKYMGQFDAVATEIFAAAEHHAKTGNNILILGALGALKELHNSLSNSVSVNDTDAWSVLGQKINALQIACVARKENLSDLTHFVQAPSRSGSPGTPSIGKSSQASFNP